MKRPSRPPAHTRYLSSPAEATLHGKTQGFVLRLPPQHKPHATFMQPLQYVSQHHVANLHVSITWQHQMTTIMQPFHSDLQAQIRDTHRTTHTGTTTRCRTQRGTHSRMKRPSRPPAHTRYLSSPAEATLYTEKHKVSCSGFLPNTSPMQHPCNHYNAFRSITSQFGTYLRTWQHQMTTIMQPFHSDLQAQIQDTHRTTHTGTTTRCRTQRRNTFADETAQPPPRTHEVPFIAGRSHFTRKNTRFRAPASSPTQAPCNIHATITMRFAASRRKPARIYAHGNTR